MAARLLFHFTLISCTVFSGDRIALLLIPGTGEYARRPAEATRYRQTVKANAYTNPTVSLSYPEAGFWRTLGSDAIPALLVPLALWMRSRAVAARRVVMARGIRFGVVAPLAY